MPLSRKSEINKSSDVIQIFWILISLISIISSPCCQNTGYGKLFKWAIDYDSGAPFLIDRKSMMEILREILAEFDVLKIR